MPKIPTLLWLVVSVIFFAFGEYLSKKFALSPSLRYVLLILGVYTIGTLAWLPAILQKNQLSIVGSLWSVLSLAATVGIGLILFHEKISRIGIIGILFAATAVALLSAA